MFSYTTFYGSERFTLFRVKYITFITSIKATNNNVDRRRLFQLSLSD